MKKVFKAIFIFLVMASALINQGLCQNLPGGGTDPLTWSKAMAEESNETEEKTMAKNMTQVAKSGGDTYFVKDMTARSMISDETTAREAAVSAEAAARDAAIASEAAARDAEIDNLQNVVNDNLNDNSIITTYYQGGFLGARAGIPVSNIQLNDNTNRIRSISTNSRLEDAFFVPGGTVLRLYVDDGYKYAYQIFSSISRVGVDEFTIRTTAHVISMEEDYYFIVWIGKTDDSIISPSDGVHFHAEIYNDIKNRINNANEDIKQIDRKAKRFSFVNIYNPNSLLSLPEQFDNFPINVDISRSGSAYGYNLINMDYYIHTAGAKTYYVSTKGNDNDSGLTPENAFKTITKALSMSDVDTIILLSGTYFNGVHWTEKNITKSVNIIGDGLVIFDNKSSNEPLNIKTSCYIENIIFKHGSSCLQATLTEELCTLFNCRFEESQSNSAFSVLGGHILMINCSVDKSYGDGFNYHTNEEYSPQVVEIECFGQNCGNNSASLTSNCSTIHDPNARIIRIGCEYRTSKGAVVADADLACSINIAVRSTNTIGHESTTRDGNFGSLSGSKMWLYDCISFGSPKDIIADNAQIFTTKTYNSEYTVNNGRITHIE